MRMRHLFGLVGVAITLLEPARAQADAPGIEYQTYFEVIRDSRRMTARGDAEGAQNLLSNTLDQIIAPDGEPMGEFLKFRPKLLTDSMLLRGQFGSSGRLAFALREQERSEQMVNAWVRSEGGAPAFNCLFDAPPPQLPDHPSAMVWRMRTARASILQLQGLTWEALELLERTVKEAPGTKQRRGWVMDYELRRTYDEIASMLAFLGYWEEAVDAFDEAIANTWRTDAKTTRALALLKLNRLFPMAKQKGYTPEIVAEANGLLETHSGVLDERDRAGFKRQIAKFEYRAGRAKEARARVDGLLSEKGSLSVVDRMNLERIFFVEDSERSDEDATDADYEAMLDAYRDRGMLRSLPTVYRSYAQFLGRAGRTREAIPMAMRAAELTAANGWQLHLPPLWAQLAILHDKLGEHQEAAGYWTEIDQLMAELGASDRGLPQSRTVMAGFQKIAWLERNGQVAAARETLGNLRRSVDRNLMGAIDLATLDSIEIADFEKEAVAVEPPAAPRGDGVAVAIEPLATRSLVTKKGAVARTRFSLLNPSSNESRGELRVHGAPLALALNPDRTLSLTIGKGAETGSVPISLAPQERLVIEASCLPSDQACKLEWVEGDRVESSSEWSITTEELEKEPLSVRATTASIARRSAFYATPLYQEIRWPEGLERETKNFRMRSSSEAWVSYQLPDGKTIAVDANGDGDFEDAGDSITSGYDSDHNLLPDATAKGDDGIFGLEIFVYPDVGQTEAIALDFELLEPDKSWRIAAKNQLGKP